jgi:hypothetical protein
MSPLLDDQGRLGGRVSIIDVLVLLLLVALAVFAVTRYSSQASAEQPVRITLTLEEIRDPTVVQFAEGDVIYEDTGALLGTVDRVEVAPTKLDVPTDSGEIRLQDSKGFSDVDLELLGEGRVSSSSIEVGGRPVQVGKLIQIVGPGYSVRVRVSGVEVVEE